MLRKVQGPECPVCGCRDSVVLDWRDTWGDWRHEIRRCNRCGREYRRAVRLEILDGTTNFEKPRRGGAVCPRCGEFVPAYRTMSGAPVIRYHACGCGARFKSVER